jgi:hypothetical protein
VPGQAVAGASTVQLAIVGLAGVIAVKALIGVVPTLVASVSKL